VSVDFDLDVIPAGNYRIEFYANPSGSDPSGKGEGETRVSSVVVSHTGAGVESFSHTFAGSSGDELTTTATEDLGGGTYGSTSEFSASVVVSGNAPVLDPVGPQSGDELTLIGFTATATSSTPQSPTYVRSGGASAATSFTMDIGAAGTQRLVTIGASLEGSSPGLTGVTVDGKAATLVSAAENPDGAANHSELWYIDEDSLGSSSGTVTIAIQGGSIVWAVAAALHTGVGQNGPDDFGVDATTVGGTTINPAGIDVAAGGLVVGVFGEGTSGLTVSSATPPLTNRQTLIPTSADLFFAEGIEASAQTNKSYVLTLSGAHNRASAVVASWPASGSTLTFTLEGWCWECACGGGDYCCGGVHLDTH
jgi:hypothetical protein